VGEEGRGGGGGKGGDWGQGKREEEVRSVVIWSA